MVNLKQQTSEPKTCDKKPLITPTTHPEALIMVQCLVLSNVYCNTLNII